MKKSLGHLKPQERLGRFLSGDKRPDPVLGFCVAECVDHRVFQSPLNLSEVDLPATYEN
jgi:hypothetical protein